jgi:plastocyanin
MPQSTQGIIVVCTLAVAVGACRGGARNDGSRPAQEAPPASQPAGVPTAPVPGGGVALPGEGVITGRVTFDGTVPTPRMIRTASDPLCMPEGGAVRSEVLVVGPANALQNVFVYVKDGLGNRTFPAPQAPVVLDQQGCRYTPHVFGVQVGQPVEIVNSDPTLHNVHAIARVNDEFNFAQPIKNMRSTRTFDEPEIMVPFRCDVHGWMAAYAGVLPHPYYAVSREDGRFEIRGLPEGTYTIEAWHEQLGTNTHTVTSDGQNRVTADFTFASRAE